VLFGFNLCFVLTPEPPVCRCLHSSEASRWNVQQLSEHAFVKTPIASFFVAGAGAKNIPKNCPQYKINGNWFLLSCMVCLYHCY